MRGTVARELGVGQKRQRPKYDRAEPKDDKAADDQAAGDKAAGEGLTWVTFVRQATLRVQQRLQSAAPCAPEFLELAQHLLTRQNLDEVVAERETSRRCGWPLCTNTLTMDWAEDRSGRTLEDTTGRTYHLSLEHRQLFETTAVQRFCSSECLRDVSLYISRIDGGAVESRDSAVGALRQLFPQLGDEDIVRLRGSLPKKSATARSPKHSSQGPFGVVFASETTTIPPKSSEVAAAAPSRREPPSAIRVCKEKRLVVQSPKAASEAAPEEDEDAMVAAAFAEAETARSMLGMGHGAAAAKRVEKEEEGVDDSESDDSGGLEGGSAEGDADEEGEEWSEHQSEDDVGHWGGPAADWACLSTFSKLYTILTDCTTEDTRNWDAGGDRSTEVAKPVEPKVEAKEEEEEGEGDDGQEVSSSRPPLINAEAADGDERRAVFFSSLEREGKSVAAMITQMAQEIGHGDSCQKHADPLHRVRPLLRTFAPRQTVPLLTTETATALLLLLWRHAAVREKRVGEAAAAAALLSAVGVDLDRQRYLRELLGSS
eukprot:Hpha_TRINITY_DN15709_c4_g1::TRINITY_DN15709_c4_g1_i1::g.37285::m.37285